jgi:hypothetical protein
MNLEEKKGIGEVLGRLSQMIEELPWLWEFEAKCAGINSPMVVRDILITIKSGGAIRPSY